MSKISLTGNPSGTGVLTIAAPNTNTDRTLTLPDAAGTMFSQGNIVGTVSESSGVPTGAIIEQGSNANGRFVKYADGTMHAYMYGVETRSASGSVATTITLPVTFVDAAVSSSSTASNELYSAVASILSSVPATATSSSVDTFTTTTMQVRIVRSNTTSTAFTVFVIGRWF